MTESEYWIMDVVLECRDTITALRPDDIDMLESYYNRKGHGLSHEQLVDTLDQMFQRGDIIAEKYEPGETGTPCERSVSGLYCPSRKEIEDELRSTSDDVCVYFGLTEQGGEKWEIVSHPDWNLYLNRYRDRDERDVDWVEMEASNRPLLQEFLERDLQEGSVLADTIEWEEFVPWEVSYWKSLPRSYRVRYQVRPDFDIIAHKVPA